MKVLIVDDNEQNLYMLETLLRGNGYQVTSAHDGHEALAALKDGGADLVISDILMPAMDGYHLCRALRADDTLKNIPLIFYTATYTDEKDARFGLGLGADRYLIKPQEPEVILQTVSELLSERETEKTDNVPAPENDAEFFRQHNDVLFRKLEKKIHDLEMTNHALQESIQQTRAILNNIPDIAWLKDIEHRYVAVNKSFTTCFGTHQYEILWKTDFDIWPGDLADLHLKDDTEVINSRSSIRFEERITTCEGKKLFVETIKSPVFDSAGDIIGTTGIARDITERKKADEERAVLEEQLRQAQKMEAIGQLAGGVAHDFNNLLTTIVGFASIAQLKMTEDDPNHLNIERILAATHRATVLTQSLLSFGRRQVMNLTVMDLNEVLARFEKFLMRVLREGIDIETRCCIGQLPIMADRGQLEQVVMNLVTNSRDAMPHGGHIIVETNLMDLDRAFVCRHGFGEAGTYASLSVTDTGSGISEEIRHKIFEPFFTTKVEGKGTGLGLSMVYGIIRQHKGAIDVDSRPGVGTTFKIYLPLTVGDKPPETESNALLRGGNETILIADDNETIRKLTATLLGQYGYHVIEAINGQDAVAKTIENRDRIQLVLLEGNLPLMNGKQAWMEIKALNPGIKAIFIDGYSENLFTKGEVSEEDACFIQKPVYPSVLLTKIRQLLDTP